MVDEYKRILLVKGLQNIDDYHFRMLKSLLARNLKLTSKAQDKYDRIKIADLMEAKFPGVACVNKLIELIEGIKELEELKQNLRMEMLKVAKKTKAERTTSAKKSNQEETGSATPAPTTSSAQAPERGKQSPVAQNQKAQVQRKVAARGSVLQKGPMTVMVLKATELFEYESPDKGKSTMFHATVVTASQFFQVKVLNANLKEKFIKQKVITISDYFECKGILEVNEASSVSEAGPDQKLEVPNSIIKRANETPKIDNLHKQASGTFVYGLFELHQKRVNVKNTIYEIQDKTGKMDVVGNGKWHDVQCKEGDKLRLFCFKLRTIDRKLKLACVDHSFIKVVKNRGRTNQS